MDYRKKALGYRTPPLWLYSFFFIKKEDFYSYYIKAIEKISMAIMN